MNTTCKDCIHYPVCADCDPVKVEVFGEDSTLEPDGLCNHFKDKSRFIELPCAVGDVVYAYKHDWREDSEIVPYQITNITITQNKKGIWTKKYRAMLLIDGKTIDWQINFGFDEIGKTVFLTKEEAEKALKGGAE